MSLLTRWLTTAITSLFCILLMIKFATPLHVTYQPTDNDVLLCSANYILFVESNFTVSVTLDQSGTFTLSLAHSNVGGVGGDVTPHVETRSYTNDGISSTIIIKDLPLTGMYNVTVTTPAGRLWRKEIRITDSPVEIQDATITQRSAMPGELLSGNIDNQVPGADYVWYTREKVNTNIGLTKLPWKLIQTGTQMTVRFNWTGVYELLLSKSHWQSQCRKKWEIYVYTTYPKFVFSGPSSSPNDPPVKGRPRDVTCTVYNNSQPGDVIWKYGSQEVVGCRGRSQIVREQIFTCRLEVVDFVKQLEVRLHPDDPSKSQYAGLMKPIAGVDIWPRYVQAGTYSKIHIRNDVDGTWTLSDSNHVKRIWRGVRLWDGVSKRNIENVWSTYYRISNSPGGADVVSVDLFNQISHIQKTVLVYILDTNSFQLRASFEDGNSVMFTSEAVVPMGQRVVFTIIDSYAPDDMHYTWDIPTLTNTSLVTPDVGDSYQRTFIMNDDVVNIDPTPWSFTFKITPRLEGVPNGVQVTRLVRVHVYKQIGDVETIVYAPDVDVRSALVVGTRYEFKVVWSGSDGSCHLLSATDDDAGAIMEGIIHLFIYI